MIRKLILYLLRKQLKPFIIRNLSYDYKITTERAKIFKEVKYFNNKTVSHPFKPLRNSLKILNIFNCDFDQRQRDIPISLILRQGNE